MIVSKIYSFESASYRLSKARFEEIISILDCGFYKLSNELWAWNEDQSSIRWITLVVSMAIYRR